MIANTKCPKCGCRLEVSLTAAPPMQSETSTVQIPGGTVGELLESIQLDSLDSNSREFVQQTCERYDKYGDRIRMSEKQLAWLKKLAAGDGDSR